MFLKVKASFEEECAQFLYLMLVFVAAGVEAVLALGVENDLAAFAKIPKDCSRLAEVRCGDFAFLARFTFIGPIAVVLHVLHRPFAVMCLAHRKQRAILTLLLPPLHAPPKPSLLADNVDLVLIHFEKREKKKKKLRDKKRVDV